MPDKENKQEGQQPREKRKYNLTKPRPTKKEQIIQGAIKAMCFYGYDGATMEKIALNAGVSKALIGRHFGSKENLAGVCLQRIFEHFFERAKSIAEKSADYREQTDKMFMLFQSSLPELRLFISLLAIPALEHIAKENLPFLSGNTHNVVGTYEVCAGMASVTLNKPSSPLEVINDLDYEIVNLFSLLADRVDGLNLLDRLLHLRYCEDNFVLAKRAQLDMFRGIDRITMAVMTYTLITQSFNACRQSYRKGINQHDYFSSNLQHLPRVHERLIGVRVMNYDATYILNKVHSHPNAFVFADLPYLHDLRATGACDVYGMEMSRAQHVNFLETARDAKCGVMICGYRQEQGRDLYDSILLGHGNWRHYLLAELPKSCKTTASKGIGREWVWLNYEPPEHAKYFINLDSANW